MTRPGQGTTARDLRDSAWSMPGAPSTPAEAPELSAPSAPMLPLSPEGSYSVLPLSHLEATARSAASEGTSSLPNAESCTVQITFNTVLNRHRDTCEAAHSTYSPSQRYPVIRHVVPAQAAAGPHTSVEQRLECPSSSSHHPGCAGNDQFRPDCFDTAWQASPTGKAHRPTQSAFAQPHVTQQDPMGHVHHMRSESAPQDQSLRQLAYARQLNSPLKAPGGFAAALPSFGQPAQPAAMLQQPPVPETSHAHLQLELQQYPSWEQQLHSQPDSQDLWQQQQQQLHPQWHAHTQSQQQQWQQHLSPVEAARDMRHIQTKAGRSLSTALDRAAGSVSVPAAKPSAMQAADIELAPLRNGLIRSVMPSHMHIWHF